MTRERLLEPDEVAGAGGAQRRARDQPLEILDAFERVAEFAAFRRPKGELLDGIEAILDRAKRQQRPEQPRSQQAARHRRDRSIELVEQRTLATAFRPLEDLEMLERRRIDEQGIGALPIRDRANVGEIGFLRAAQIVNQRSCRAHGRRGVDRGRILPGRRRAAVRAGCGARPRRRMPTSRRT